MSIYNADTVCGPCTRREQDAYVMEMEQRSRERPFLEMAPDTCRKDGCDRPISAKSAKTNAPRWRKLCVDHYEEQRARSASSMRSWRMASQAQR